MKKAWKAITTIGLAACILAVLVGAPLATGAEEPTPNVINVDAKGEFVRLGYNDEGWVVLGYRVTNGSVGEEWILLDVGMTVLQAKGQEIKREAITVTTPDGSVLPMATQDEYTKAQLQNKDKYANRLIDSISYFPAGATQSCFLEFFSSPSQPYRGLARDQVSLNPKRQCIGRIYFHVPGGIQMGRYFLNVQFAGSVVSTPFKIMTKEELKEAKKEYDKIVKEAKEKAKEEKKKAKEEKKKG